MTDPQVVARGSIVATDSGGVVQHGVRPPWRLASQPQFRPRPAPELGGDTRAVLAAAGLCAAEVDRIVSARPVS